MVRVVRLKDCYGVLQWLDEVRACYVVVYAAGPSVPIVCDKVQQCSVVFCYLVSGPLAEEDGLL